MPARPLSQHSCTECGAVVAKWLGRCPQCQSWGSIGAAATSIPARPPVRALLAGPVTAPARPIGQVDVAAARARPSGVSELDRVLGGGLVPGAVILLAGEPGVGKSTLLLDVAARYAEHSGARSLVVTGEESTAQVRLRAERTGSLDPGFYLAAETDLAAVLGHVDAVAPGLLIVDSVQTVGCAEIDGGAGGVAHVRAVTAALTAVAKQRGITCVLVGHVTKDGAIAGPRALEHLVDVVLYFEGDRHTSLRLLRAVKNRYGAADEVGCFELSDDGIRGLADPSGLFLSRRAEPVAGSAVAVAMEGRRPMLAEVQALLANTQLAMPRRATSGLDSARMAMVLAVIEQHGGVTIGKRDVYLASVGGMRLAEPAIDLAVALAVASIDRKQPLPQGVVAIGELGLSGEVRPVASVGRRLAEAVRLGFTTALVPTGPAPLPPGMTVHEVSDLRAALRVLAH